MNFYIPIEVKNREFYAKILLAKYAEDNGFTVIVGRKNELNELVLNMRAGVYIGLGAFENFRVFFKSLKLRGFHVVISEEEGLVTYSDEMYIDMRVSKKTLEYVDQFFTWGDENLDVLSKGLPKFADKFKVTGNARFDLLKPEFSKVYRGEITKIKEKYGQYILICTSFSSINHFDPDLDYEQSLIDKKTLKTAESITNFKRYSKLKSNTFNAFLEAIPALAKQNPHVSVIIRPHPSENRVVYEQFTNKYSNVFVDMRFSVHPWIIQAEALIHHYCTTSIEAYAAGTPRFSLRPERDSLSEKEVPFECSCECLTVDELVSSVSKCIVGLTKHCHDMKPTMDYSHYVLNMGDVIASSKIVKYISSFKDKDKDIVSNTLYKSIMSWGQEITARLIYTTKKNIRILLKLSTSNSYQSHKFDKLSVDEIENVLRSLDKNSSLEKYKCEKIVDNFVKITSA